MHTHSNREQSQGTKKTGQQTDRPMFLSRRTDRRQDNRQTDPRFWADGQTEDRTTDRQTHVCERTDRQKTGQQTDRPTFVSGQTDRRQDNRQTDPRLWADRQTGRRRWKTDNRLTDSRFSGILSLGNQLIDLRSRVWCVYDKKCFLVWNTHTQGSQSQGTKADEDCNRYLKPPDKLLGVGALRTRQSLLPDTHKHFPQTQTFPPDLTDAHTHTFPMDAPTETFPTNTQTSPTDTTDKHTDTPYRHKHTDIPYRHTQTDIRSCGQMQTQTDPLTDRRRDIPHRPVATFLASRFCSLRTGLCVYL